MYMMDQQDTLQFVNKMKHYPTEYKYSKKIRLVANYVDFEYYVQVRFLFMWFTIGLHFEYSRADAHARHIAHKRGLI